MRVLSHKGLPLFLATHYDARRAGGALAVDELGTLCTGRTCRLVQLPGWELVCYAAVHASGPLWPLYAAPLGGTL
jgi:hypothetical protein